MTTLVLSGVVIGGMVLLFALGVLVSKSNRYSVTLTDSDTHEGKLMLFVEVLTGFKKENRVIVANHKPVRSLTIRHRYSPNETVTLGSDGGYGNNSRLKLVHIHDAYWVDTGKPLSEEQAKKLIEQYDKREKIKEKLEEGANLIRAYKKDLMQLPQSVGGE